jgi:hypothetical protein
MAYLQKNLMKTIMVFIVFFSAIAPVYGSVITPAIKSYATGFDTKNVSMTMPCHKMDSHKKNSPKVKVHQQTSDQSACFKHCLQYLNDPCLASAKPELKNKAIKQTSVKYSITEVQKISSITISDLSNKGPPKQIVLSSPLKGLSSLLLSTSRLRQ